MHDMNITCTNIIKQMLYKSQARSNQQNIYFWLRFGLANAINDHNNN